MRIKKFYLVGFKTDLSKPRTSRAGKRQTRDDVKKTAYVRMTFLASINGKRFKYKTQKQFLERFEKALKQITQITPNITYSLDTGTFEVLPGVFDFYTIDKVMDLASEYGCRITIRLSHADHGYDNLLRWQRYWPQRNSDGTINHGHRYYGSFSTADKEPQKAVEKAIPEIVKAIDEITLRLKSNGRLFYIGTGTSGRLGVLDASECPPTFCTEPDLIQGLIAGGEPSLTRSSESLEDLSQPAIFDLKDKKFSNKDVLIGITASGRTPYVLAALNYSKSINALTISISSVPFRDSSISTDIDIRLITGPEILAGSTRLKAGTATKMALNIISTSVMIQLGKVYGNRMIDLSVTNDKLLQRALGILLDIGSVDKEEGLELLNKTNGSVKLSLLIALSGMDVINAKKMLDESQGNLRTALSKVCCD